MQTNELHRKLAAWLLTLPAPIVAESRDEAASLARKQFDRALAQGDFNAALADLGYALIATRDNRYAFAPIQRAAA